MTVDLASPTPSITVTPVPPTAIPETPTLVPATATAEAPVPQYEVSTLPEFKNLGVPVYEIPVDDYQHMENGRLEAWLDSNAKPFDETKVINPPLRTWNNGEANYGPLADNKLFSSKDARPWHMSTVVGHTRSGGFDYLDLFIQYHDPANPSKPLWIKLVHTYSVDVPGRDKYLLTPSQIKANYKTWVSSDQPYFMFPDRYPYKAWLKDDLIYQGQQRYPSPKLEDMENKYVTTGVPTDLATAPGVVLWAMIATVH